MSPVISLAKPVWLSPSKELSKSTDKNLPVESAEAPRQQLRYTRLGAIFPTLVVNSSSVHMMLLHGMGVGFQRVNCLVH